MDKTFAFMYKFFLASSIFLFPFVIAQAAVTVTVGTSKTVAQGGQATLTWNISDGSNCIAGMGTPSYPINGDGINAFWQGSKSSGSQIFTVSVSTSPGAYLFTCRHYDSISGLEDARGEATLTVTAAPSPDLIAGAISPTTAIVGQTVSYSSLVQNSGSLTTGRDFQNFIQYSTGPNGTGNLFNLASSNMTMLGAGGSLTTSRSNVFAVVGTYYMRACADATSPNFGGVITESDENNNCGPWTTITIAAGTPVPDLIANAISPTSGTAGQSITFSSTIQNIGSRTTGAAFYNFMQYSTEPNGGVSFSNLNATTMSILGAGGSSNTSQGHTFATAGTYYMRACADATSPNFGDSITESDENNNCGPWTTISIVDALVTGVCGTAEGVTPRNPEPTGSFACQIGTFNQSSPADTPQLWNWSCNTTTCSAPKYGCIAPFNYNYNPSGPNNNYGCSNQCYGGRTWNTSTETCDLPPGSDCPAQPVNWGAGCSANVGLTTPSGGTVSGVNNTSPSFSGTANFSCTNGTLNYTSGTCTSTGCSIDQYLDGGTCTSCPVNSTSAGGSGTVCSCTIPGQTWNSMTRQCEGVSGGSCSGTVAPPSQTVTASVTGSPVYGSGPFTTDSPLTKIAKFLGAPEGGSATLTVTDLGCVTGYTGSTANGVTTLGYGQSWRAMSVSCTSGCGGGGGAMSGTLSAPSCTIGVGQSFCNSSVTWTTFNPVATSQVVADGGGGPNSSSANSSTQSLAVAYPGKTFRLYNNGVELAAATPAATCAGGSSWNGTICASTASVDCSPGPVSWGGGCTGNISSTVLNGNTSPSVNNTAANLSGSAVFSCSAGSFTYQSGSCTVQNAIPGSGVLAIASCTIGMGYSTCDAPLSWTTNGTLYWPTVYRTSADDGVRAQIGSGRNLSPGLATTPLHQGSNVIALHDGSFSDPLLDTKTVLGTCIAGSTWSVAEGICKSNNPALSGTLSASPTSCTVGYHQSSCTVNLTWMTLNSVGMSAITRDGTAGDIYTATSGLNQSTVVPYESDNNVTFRLYNNATELASANVAVSCAANQEWDPANNRCEYSPCSANQYLSSLNGNTCRVCPAGSTSAGGLATSCTCPVGTPYWNPATETCIVPVKPDLTTSLSQPLTFTVGVTDNIISTINNTASTSTGTGFDGFLQYSTLPNGGGTLTNLLPSRRSTPLLGNSTANLNYGILFTSTGTYYGRACIDKSDPSSTGEIDESNEGNNCSTWEPITIDFCPGTPVTARTEVVSVDVNNWVGGGIDPTYVYIWGSGPFHPSSDLHQIAAFLMGQLGTAVTLEISPAGCVSRFLSSAITGVSGGQGLVTQTSASPYQGMNVVCTSGCGPVRPSCPVDGYYDTSMGSCQTCPAGSTSSGGYVTSCQCDTGTWNTQTKTCDIPPSTPLPTGSLTANPPSCTVAVGSSTCASTLSWNVVDPSGGIVVVRRHNDGVNIYAGYALTGSNIAVTVPYIAGGVVTYDLSSNIYYNIDSATINLQCASGSSWDAGSGTCLATSCPVNSFFNTTTGSCASCPAGSTSAGGSIISCTCSVGNWNASTNQCDVTPLPDLIADDITPIVATVGVSTVFSSTITNQGSLSTGASFDNFIQYSASSNGSGAVDLAPASMSTLAVGAGALTSRARTFNTPGTYYMRACADKSDSADAGTIAEGLENNNCGNWTQVIVSNPTCPTGEYSLNGVCVVCTAGNYCPGGPNPPTICPVNAYCPGGNTPPGGPNPPTACPVATPFSLAGSIASWQCTAGSLPTGTLDANPTSCAIATGQSTCQTTLTWSTSNPIGTSAVTRDGLMTDLYTGNSGNQTTNVPYEADGAVIYRLYNNANEVAMTTVTVSCAAGPANWDTVNGKCADPQVGSVVVTGDYYNNPGSLDFTCINSDRYQVIRDPSGVNVVISSGIYSGPKSVPVSIEDNYQIVCKKGSVQATQTVIYHYPAPSATISVDAYPKTISPGGKSTLSWSISFPVAACALTALPVCTNGICSQAQSQSATALNYIIATQQTDAPLGNSGNGGSLTSALVSRSISSAIRNIAPGHTTTDFKALGQKSFTITNSADFVIDCGGGKRASTRVRVVNSNEQ